MGWNLDGYGTKVVWRICCDRCGADGPAADYCAQAESAAHSAGWLVTKCLGQGQHLCPKCRETSAREIEARAMPSAAVVIACILAVALIAVVALCIG